MNGRTRGMANRLYQEFLNSDTGQTFNVDPQVWNPIWDEGGAPSGNAGDIPVWAFGGNQFDSANVGGVDPGYLNNFQRQQIHGGMSNQELYDTQFANLLGQHNDFQNQQQQAAAIRAQNAAAPVPAYDSSTAFDWYNKEGGGLRPVQLSIADEIAGEIADGTAYNPLMPWGGLSTFFRRNGPTTLAGAGPIASPGYASPI